MLKKVVVFFAILTAMASFSVASASQLVRVLQGNTLWGITEALGQPGSSWTQLYQENPDLPPITVRQGKNIAWIQAGQYLLVPDNWNLGSADQGYVEVYPGYVLPSTSSIVSTSSVVHPLAWMGSAWFQVLVVGTVLLLVFVLGAVLVRCFGQPMYGGFPGMPMFQPMRNEVNITLAGVPPAAPVVGEVSAPAAPVVASTPTVPAVPVVDVMTPAEAEPSARAETPAAG